MVSRNPPRRRNRLRDGLEEHRERSSQSPSGLIEYRLMLAIVALEEMLLRYEASKVRYLLA